MKDGGAHYSIYVYLSSIPRFLGATRAEGCDMQEQTAFRRIITIPGVEQVDIGKCSVLKLDLEGVSEKQLIAFVDRLHTSEFNVWWTSLNTVQPRHRFLDDVNMPWSVCWLLSHGYKVSEQLFDEDVDLLYKHEDILYSALKGVLSREIVVNVISELKLYLHDQPSGLDGFVSPGLPNNYTLIRKVVVTPTRVIFLPPEPVQMNRVLRKYDPDNFIMALFRDEDLQLLDPVSSATLEEPIARMKAFLSDGIKADGKTYTFLGCSSSQLCKHSCWMYANDPRRHITLEEILYGIGDLTDIRSVPLYISRFGQFLSSSFNAVDLSELTYQIIEIPDVESNGCCFTHGVGKISTDVAEQIANGCGLSIPSSGFQVVFGGCKGILVADPQIPKGEVHIRPSMKQFDSSHKVLEVVDYSRPQCAHLNRQTITMMSQRGVADEVFFRLQDDYLYKLLEMLTSNEMAYFELDGIQVIFDVKELRDRGISIISDQFFRSLLLVKYEEHLHDLLENTHIPLPLDKGRVLMGVIDESGQLESGQIFIQYSKDADNVTAGTTIVEGPVMITQNPCLYPADLRSFQAVDCPKLYHLVDCLVFSIQGDLPNRSEISRAAADDNWYWTTWHPDLIIRENCEPVEKINFKSNELQRMPTQEDIIEYFANFLNHNNPEDVINTHLAHAEMEEKGIFSEKCLELARLYSAAVDFGEPTSINSKLKPTLFPDFMMRKNRNHENSERIIGKLFRRVTPMVLTSEMHLDVAKALWETDKNNFYTNKPEFGQIAIPGFYRELVERYYQDYAARMQNILDKYEITDESHLFASLIYDMTNSCCLTNGGLQWALLLRTEIGQLKKYFSKIFEANDISVSLPTKSMAWCTIAYQKGRFKSFAWIASSVLASVAETNGTRFLPCGIDEIDYLDPKNIFNMSHVDKEISRFLQLQDTATKMFLTEIRNALPDLECSLIPIDLAKWHIPSVDVYIQLEHSNVGSLEKGFAELCSVIPKLNLIQSDKTTRLDCYITERIIAKKVLVAGQEFIVHVYCDGLLGEDLRQIALNISSGLLGRCLQVLSQFWRLYSKRSPQKHVSVIHICKLTLFYLKIDNNASLNKVLYDFFRMFTDADILLEIQRSSFLSNLRSEDFKFIQQNLLEGLQLLTLSGTHFVLNHKLGPIQNQHICKRITMSTTVWGVLCDQKETVVKCFSVSSGCKVGIRRSHDETSDLYIVEGFGTKQQLLTLMIEIQHFENVVCKARFSRYSLSTGTREPIFEDSYSENDSVVIIPYNKCSYLPNKYKKLTLFVRPISNDFNEERNLQKIFVQYLELVDTVRAQYDEAYHGYLRLVCRFTNFNFSSGERISNYTVADFVRLLNSKPKHMRSCHYPAGVDVKKLNAALQNNGLKPDKTTTDKTIISMCIKPLANDWGRDLHFDVVVNKDLKIQHLRHQPLRIGSVELFRKMRNLPGCKHKEKMADICIRLQGRSYISDSDTEQYSFVTESEEPILTTDDSQLIPNDDLPFLTVHPKFSKLVSFVKQKRTTQYRFPSSAMTQKPGHFTAHVKVGVSKVREYDFRKREYNNFTEAVLVVPTLPPLHCQDEHQVLIKNILELAIMIGNTL